MRSYETTRCLVREMQLADAPLMLHNFSDARLMAQYGMERLSTLPDAECLLKGWLHECEQGIRQRWTIVLKADDSPIGTCGFHGIDLVQGCAEVGYEISRSHWGQGILSEVFPVLLAHAFDVLQLDRVTARVSPGNDASIALLRKSGFRNRLIPQLAGWLRGASPGMLIFRLYASEFRARLTSSSRPSLTGNETVKVPAHLRYFATRRRRGLRAVSHRRRQYSSLDGL